MLWCLKVVQLLLDPAPPLERRAQQLDAVWLSNDITLEVWPATEGGVTLPNGEVVGPKDLPRRLEKAGASLVHIYGPPLLSASFLARIKIPYVASGIPAKPWFPWPALRGPAVRISPLGQNPIPEAVDPGYFLERKPRTPGPDRLRIGSFIGDRQGAQAFCELSYARLERFRDDIDWNLFEQIPTPDEFETLDLWVDPARPDDPEGLVPEALATQTPVVAVRTNLNRDRLDDGKSGFLVRPDPNEMTHAVATALFKSEQSAAKWEHARGRRSRFHPSGRAVKLLEMYRSLTNA